MDKARAEDLYGQAKILAAQGEHTQALAILAKLLQHYPKDPSLLYAKAVCLSCLSETITAICICAQLKREHSHSQANELLKRLVSGGLGSTTFSSPRSTSKLVVGDRTPRTLSGRLSKYLSDTSWDLASKSYLAGLQSQKPEVFRSAALGLAALRDVRAVGPLIEAMRGTYTGSLASDALVTMGDIAIEALIDALGNPLHSHMAGCTLEKFGNAAVEPLTTVLKTGNLCARKRAVAALGTIRDPRAVEPLIVAMWDEDFEVRRAAIDWLASFCDSRALLPALQLLMDEFPRMRLGAACLLGELGDTGAVQPLILSLEDEDVHVRRVAATALGKIGDRRAVEPLVITLHDEDAEVRKAAVDALGAIGDARAAEKLFGILQQSLEADYRIRRSIAWALVQFRDSRVLDTLIEFLSDGSDHCSGASNRAEAAKLMGELGDNQAVDSLIHSLESDVDPYVREAAAAALGEIGDGRALDPLIKGLTVGYRSGYRILYCFSCAVALGKLHDPRGVPALLAALDHAGGRQESWIGHRRAAVTALIEIVKQHPECAEQVCAYREKISQPHEDKTVGSSDCTHTDRGIGVTLPF
jgi:HEAT repeat protein